MTKAKEAHKSIAGKPPEINIDGPTNKILHLHLSGEWGIEQQTPSIEEMEKRLDSDSKVQKITFDTSEITDWDSSLLTFLMAFTTTVRSAVLLSIQTC